MPIGSGPYSTPPLKRSRGDFGDENENKGGKIEKIVLNLTKSRADEAYPDSGYESLGLLTWREPS